MHLVPPSEERAVSPVIGVILMVAITVILAATIGAFSFETFDRDGNPAPAASFEYEYEEGAKELTIIHAAGDGFRGSTVTFTCTGTCSGITPSDWSAETDVRAGEQITLENVASGDTIRLVWQDPRSDDTTAVLSKWDGPTA